MKCSKCGAENGDGVKYCRVCGVNIGSETWNCPICETTNDTDVCVICGTHKSEVSSPVRMSPKPSVEENISPGPTPPWPGVASRPMSPPRPVPPPRSVPYPPYPEEEKTSKALVAVLIASIILMIIVVAVTTSYIVKASYESEAELRCEYENYKDSAVAFSTDHSKT